MVFDFAVRYNPATETQEQLTKKILYSLFIRPIKQKKPRVIFISGDSGEGKSYSAIRLQELLCEMQGIDITKHFEDMNVFTPLEYPKKLDNLLNNKELRKVNIICMHEAREIIKAKQWHSFLTQSIADINAMSRSIKRICFMIISQFIRDITSDVRYTLNYYITMKRNKNETKMYIMRVWKDDRDLEKPKLRKRKVFGYVIYPNGRRRKFRPNYLIIQKPNQVLLDKFEHLDTESKRDIIRKKTQKMINEMELEMTGENQKILNMVAWYMARPEELDRIGKMKRKKFVVNPNFNEMHDLTPVEREQFIKLVQVEIVKQGYAEGTVKENIDVDYSKAYQKVNMEEKIEKDLVKEEKEEMEDDLT